MVMYCIVRINGYLVKVNAKASIIINCNILIVFSGTHSN